MQTRNTKISGNIRIEAKRLKSNQSASFQNRFFHSHLYSIYSHSTVIPYSLYSHSIVNLYSFGLCLVFICRSARHHLPFSFRSVNSQYILIQTYSIVFRLVNPKALHLGRPPPVLLGQ